jgi:hypothetical protein
MERCRRATVDLAALVERAERAVMPVPAALEALVVLGLAATVVWVRQASAAMVAVAVLAAPGSMRAVSPTAPLVVTPGRAALVERVVQRARLARTLRRCSAVLAVSAVTPGSLVVALRV